MLIVGRADLKRTEEEIIKAMKILYERMKIVVEPSGAVGLAAALSPQFCDGAGNSCKYGTVPVLHLDLAVILCCALQAGWYRPVWRERGCAQAVRIF